MHTASIGATNASRPRGRSVTPGVSDFNDLGICNAMDK
jgi:hypothetical protein